MATMTSPSDLEIPPFRKLALLDSLIPMTVSKIMTQWLLTFFVLSNETNFHENINEDIPTQAETIDSTTEDIRQPSPDRPVVNTSSNPFCNITTVGSSTASAIQPLAGNAFEPESSFSSLHDSQYFKNTRGNNPIQSTPGDYNSLVTDTCFLSPVYNLKTDENYKTLEMLTPRTIDPFQSLSSENVVPSTTSTQNVTEIQTFSPLNQLNSHTPCVDFPIDLENELCLPWTKNPFQSIESANYMASTSSAQNTNNVQTHLTINQFKSYNPDINIQGDIYNESLVPFPIDSLQLIESAYFLPDTANTQNISEVHTLLPIQFKSYSTKINSQEDIDDELVLPLSYQYMFDKRTSPWEMKDWDQDELNAFVIQPEKIDRLYHIVANDEDQNFRSWELCCRMDYKGEKYFVEMYANCDYTGFDCQGGGHICITKLADFFLNNMVTNDQNPDQIYRALLADGYDVQEPDPLHKMHPKFWNNSPMLKYLCHNAIFENKDVLPHFKDQLPQLLANSVDDFIKVKEWENE